MFFMLIGKRIHVHPQGITRLRLPNYATQKHPPHLNPTQILGTEIKNAKRASRENVGQSIPKGGFKISKDDIMNPDEVLVNRPSKTVATKVPFLCSTIYSWTKYKGPFLSTIKLVWWKRLVNHLLLCYFAPHINSHFWADMDLYASASLCAVAEALETHSPERIESLMTPMAYNLLLDNYLEWSRKYDYRLRLGSVHAHQIACYVTFHLPEFQKELPVFCSPWRGLAVTFSAERNNVAQLFEQLEAFQFKVAKNYHILRYVRALQGLPKVLQKAAGESIYLRSLKRSAQRVSDMFPTINATDVIEFLKYLRSVRLFGSQFFWNHAKIELQVYYSFEALHDVHIFNSLEDSKVVSKLKQQPGTHILVFQNNVPLRSDSLQPLGQWKISEIDGLVHTEKTLINEVSKVSAYPQSVLARSNPDISFMGIKSGEDLVGEMRLSKSKLKVKAESKPRSETLDKKRPSKFLS